jgi:TfoX/Sxy family transcriptional regulator of competence genes
MGLMPDQFYDLEFGDYFLMRKGYIEKVKVDSQLLRFQTALICEAFLGKGQGTRFVMEAWQLEEKVELTREQIKQALKQKREREELARLKKEGKI